MMMWGNAISPSLVPLQRLMHRTLSRNLATSTTTKSVLVTGGSKGIGSAISRCLASDGFKVTILDIDATSREGRDLASEIGGSFIAGSVTDSAVVEQAVAAVAKEHGTLDALVNNAAVVSSQKAIGEFDLQEWRDVLDVNLNGAFYALKFGLAQMAEQQTGGAIVNMCSVCGFRAVPNIAPYTASKYALRGLTQSAAVEYADKNIRVNAIAPTSVRTDMVAQFIASYPDGPEKAEELVTAMNAQPGIVEPEDVAAVASFLLSDDSRFVTGHCLPVDAGALSRLANARRIKNS